MLYIEDITIDPHILDKIETKHGVRYEEAVEAVENPEQHVRRDRDGLCLVLSRTDAGRYLLVVLAPRGRGVWAIITARDMDAAEQHGHRKVRGK